MAIVKTEGQFPSSLAGANISYTKWASDSGKPKGILCIAHGMAEHIDRYDDFARFMVNNGYAVYGNDHLGHGRSSNADADLGYFAERDGRFFVVEDVRKLVELARAENPETPVIFLGHSMGSFIARLFCASYSGEIDGAIFMGTAGKNPAAGVGVFLVNLISLFKGEKFKSKLVDSIAFGSNNKGIPDAKTKFDWLSTDVNQVKKYLEDKWCGYLFTLSGYRELFKILKDVSSQKCVDSIRSDLPVLVISGAEDPVGGYGKGVQEVYQKLHDSALEDVSLLLYDDMRHEILNEVGKQDVYDDLLEWCNEKIDD